MIDFLFQVGLSNACFAFLLAILATVVGANSKRPHLAHLLWMLVLVKLVTPPILNVPVDVLSTRSEVVVAQPRAIDHSSDSNFEHESVVPIEVQSEPAKKMTVVTAWALAKPWLGLIWLVGTLVIVVWSLARVLHFHRLLRQNSQAADGCVLRVAQRMGEQFGMKNLPSVATTQARISPMVWWVGGKVHVVLPQVMIDEMKQDQWQWVLAHELAHVRRRDYLVRWLEWLACACFWWNPIVWLTQRNLRSTEEICCDELVLSSLNPNLHSYADSILSAVESLVCPVVRPPAMASEINSGGFLERRIEMILSGSDFKSSRSLQFCVAAFALLFIPLGIVQAQDFDAVKKRLTKAVKQDEITLEQAAIMMEALRESARDDEDDRGDPYKDEFEEQGEGYEDLYKDRDDDWDDADEERDDEYDQRKRKYSAVEKKLDELLAAGKITRRQAEARLGAIERELWDDDEEGDDDDYDDEGDEDDDYEDERRRMDYRDVAAQLMEMYKAGKISREDMGKKLNALRKRLADGDNDGEYGYGDEDGGYEGDGYEGDDYGDDDERRRMDYRDVQAQMMDMYGAGKISREDMGKKLNALRRRINDDEHDYDEENDEENDDEDERRRMDYRDVQAQLMDMYKAGRISREEMSKKLNALQKRLNDDDEDEYGDFGDDDEYEDDYEEDDDAGGLGFRSEMFGFEKASELRMISLSDLEKRIAGLEEGIRDNDRDDYSSRERDYERLTELKKKLWADSIKRLKGRAVESGKMTPKKPDGDYSEIEERVDKWRPRDRK